METEIRVCLECGNEFETNNDKKIFDSLTCKNRYNHRLRNIKLEWEISQYKARMKNIKILNQLTRRYRRNISKKELNVLGFNLKVAYLPTELDNKELAYQFGSLVLIINDDSNCKILTQKEFESYETKTT